MLVRSAVSRVLVAVGMVAIVKSQVDWRASQSPVKDQGQRGTCAAFAICGALETFPGIPGDLSEQLLYATLKLHQNDVVGWLNKLGHKAALGEGDLFDAYVQLFSVLGTSAESFLPYDPDPKRAAASVPDELKRYLELAHVSPDKLQEIRDGYGKYGFAASDCTVFDAEAAKDPAVFQKLLDAGNLGISVGYQVHGPSWSQLAQLGNTGGDGKRLFVHPGMKERFARADGAWLTYNDAKVECMQKGENFVDGVRAGLWRREPLGKAEEHGGHAVLLVGYDDRGFLAKNSWGTGWGDGGYFRIAYDYHRLYAIHGLLLAKATIRNPALSPFETTSRIEKGRFRVKVQPRGRGAEEQLLLSVWMEEPRDAAYERVEYRVEVALADGTWQQVAQQEVSAGDTTARTGAPFAVTGKVLTTLRGARAVRLTVRVGVDLRWVRTLEFAEFAAGELKGAVDLLPKS